MSYRFKANRVQVEGVEQVIVPSSLPSNPTDGFIAIDEQDGYFKVYNETLAKWVILKDSPKTFNAQFQIIGDLNYDEYIYSYSDIGSSGLLGNKNRSGDSSNGYRYSSSAPIICPFTGTLDKAVFALKGVAVSTGSAAATVTVNLELWSVGFNNEGTKLGDLDFDIDSGTYTVGNWWDSSVNTNFKGSETYNIAVSEGDLLAVKFKRVQNNSNAVGIDNLTISIQITED